MNNNIPLSTLLVAAADIMTHARNQLEQHVREQVSLGKSEVMVRAGVKASIQRTAIALGRSVSSEDLDRLCGPCETLSVIAI